MKKNILFIGIFLISILGNTQVIFEDSFFNNDKKWFEENSPKAKVKVVSKLDQYHIYHKEKSGAYLTTQPIDLKENRNFRIEAMLYKKGGTKHSGYGITWGGSDTKNFFSLLVTGDGKYLYGKAVNGTWQNITDNWRPHKTIQLGRKAFNKFKVEKIGTQYTFYINDVIIAKGKYSPFFGNQIGFNVNRKQKIIAEWIKVEYLN